MESLPKLAEYGILGILLAVCIGFIIKLVLYILKNMEKNANINLEKQKDSIESNINMTSAIKDVVKIMVTSEKQQAERVQEVCNLIEQMKENGINKLKEDMVLVISKIENLQSTINKKE